MGKGIVAQFAHEHFISVTDKVALLLLHLLCVGKVDIQACRGVGLQLSLEVDTETFVPFRVDG